MNEREPMRVWTVAVNLGVTPSTVYNMLDDGRLTTKWVGGRKFVQPDEKFDALLEAKEVKI